MRPTAFRVEIAQIKSRFFFGRTANRRYSPLGVKVGVYRSILHSWPLGVR